VNKAAKIRDNVVSKAKNYKEAIVRPTKETFQEVRTGLKHDYDLIREELSKKSVPKPKLFENAKEKISEKMNAVREKINLPTKKDVENIKTSVDTLNQKVEGMKREDTGTATPPYHPEFCKNQKVEGMKREDTV
jgi:polyhydroxyalkanoate synthesis regulator phasin